MEILTHSKQSCYVIYFKWCLFIYTEGDLIVLFYLIGILLVIWDMSLIVSSYWYFTFLLILFKYAWISVVLSFKIETFVFKMFQRGFNFPNIPHLLQNYFVLRKEVKPMKYYTYLYLPLQQTMVPFWCYNGSSVHCISSMKPLLKE